MVTNGKWYKKKLINGRKSYHVKHYKTKECKACPLRSECTNNKLGRIIERTEYAQYIERNNTRVNQNPEYYRERQQIIAHQFGTLKRHRHFDYTLMKRKKNVMSEVYIQFILYNLRRTTSIFSPIELINRLKAIKKAFLAILSTPFDIKTQINRKILLSPVTLLSSYLILNSTLKLG